MNYINQLTKDDIRELFIVLTGVGKTFDITLEDDLLWYTLCGKSHRTNASYLISLDDYYVEDSAKATKKYHHRAGVHLHQHSKTRCKNLAHAVYTESAYEWHKREKQNPELAQELNDLFDFF